MYRVANFAQHQLTLSYTLQTQSKAAQTQIEIASGKTAQQYAEIPRDANQLVSLERDIQLSEKFGQNIDQAVARLNIMESSVATMVNRATEVLGIMSQGLSGSNIDDLPLQEFSATFLSEAAALINTQHEGRYLFGGSLTDVVPVDLTDPAYTPAAGLPGVFTADVDYYQGDQTLLSVRADDSFETVYGVTGDNPAFEELLRALEYMDYAGANLDTAVLTEAYTLMKSAINGLGDMRGQIGANSLVLEKTKEGHENFKTYAENLVSSIEDTDIAAATTQLSMDELTLQGSYLALSRLSSLNLISFLS
ncbi:flagellin [Pelagibius sp. Alg239-R121]|uniref:flagellin n=1 Tax=Pelagibius sp. Alg239-R121 TaxID=2993448 RepID=UPI0024A623A1|nr:flagellin [Pelagibius sp. Alg239-R121]